VVLDRIRQTPEKRPGNAQHGRFGNADDAAVPLSGNGREECAAHSVPERCVGGYLVAGTVPVFAWMKKAGVAPDQSDAGRSFTVEH